MCTLKPSLLLPLITTVWIISMSEQFFVHAQYNNTVSHVCGQSHNLRLKKPNPFYTSDLEQILCGRRSGRLFRIWKYIGIYVGTHRAHRECVLFGQRYENCTFTFPYMTAVGGFLLLLWKKKKLNILNTL